ncbi:MAG: adenylate/guanylate cyclase domain-containing protein [Chloroflexi bacterium]|nr:adenylate/guanylate cyclase domain-containing protein [Chloroflexota bacterium]
MQAEMGYVTADDGASLAFSVAGEGPPLLCMEVPFFSHIGLEAAIPSFGSWHQLLASMFRVVRFDFRGSGASQRDIGDLTPDRLCRDIIAIADRLRLDQFAILARDASGPLAVMLAAEHPERVRRLILYGSWALGHTHPLHERIAAIEPLIDVDWQMYTEAITKVMANFGNDADAAALYLRHCVEPEIWKRATRLVALLDATAAMPRVACPTLILQPDNARLAPFGGTSDLATTIPGATLVVAKGVNLPGTGRETAGRLIAEFMGTESQARPRPGEFRTILFTDLEGHTSMMSRLGDAKGREVLREHERITREALRSYGGREVKTMGDGFLASFTSAQQAIECVVALQRLAAPGIAGESLRIRAGINAGEPISEDDDLFGASVIIAARIAARAEGGQVLVANVVRELVAGKGFLFKTAGEHVLEGLDEPIRLWELRWGGA